MKTLEQLGAVRAGLIPWTDLPVLGEVWASDPRTMPALRDKNGRVRSVATLPGYRKGQKPGNWGKRFDPTIFSIGEVRLMIMGRSRTSASGKRDRCLISMAYGCGGRISELLDLLPADVREEGGTWRVLIRCGKGGKRRVVGLAPDAVPYLQKWLECRRELGIDEHSRLFCTIAQPNPGGPLGSPQVRTMLKRIATQAGLDKRVTPHQFRHSLAVDMARRGIPLPIIARQLGHSNVATTSTYLRGLSDDEMFDAMAGLVVGAERMNQILKGTETLFDRPRGTTVCPRVFCTKHCDAASCGCSPCFCDACMRQRILARRPTSRPRVRYTPPAPVQGHLFKEQS